jgi:hypothetical protein
MPSSISVKSAFTFSPWPLPSIQFQRSLNASASRPERFQRALARALAEDRVEQASRLAVAAAQERDEVLDEE